jgi:plastocyanin
MRTRGAGRAIGVVSVLALAVAACGSSSSGAKAVKVVDLRGKASAGQYPEVAVKAIDNKFEAPAIRIDPGVTVKWTNDGRNAHNITPAKASQDFGAKFGVGTESFASGKTYEFKFAKPGTYDYYCTIHGSATKGMIGKIIVGAGAGAAGSASGASTGTKSGTIHVPADEPTVQKAVDAAKPGALVLIAPGTYHEAITVDTGHKNIVIRGEDRATTILDGDFSEAAGKENGFKVLADGVAIENLTARNFKSNGFYWNGVTGYRGSYLTSVRTGDYGIYAFGATYGQFDHDYAAGSPDAGFYIGQCFPCHAVITDVEAEWNGLGYSGTNAGGDLNLVNSSWHDNRAGIVPNSGSGEANPPQHGVTITGNTVFNNNNAQTPAIDIAKIAQGNGILVAGGDDNVVQRNLVYNHDVSGIAVVTLPEKLIKTGDPKAQNFNAHKNKVTDNVVSDSKQFDLGLVPSIDKATDSLGNCFSANTFTTSSPTDVEKLVPCGGAAQPGFNAELARFAGLLAGDKPASADYKTLVLPPVPTLANMPNAKTAKPQPATRANVPMKINVASIKVPTKK